MSIVRTDVEFSSDGIICRAWFYRPESRGSVPVVVLAHGLGGIREMRLDSFAERFAEAGYACLVFDYRHFGASDGVPRRLLSVSRQREDWRAALKFARTLPGVDPGAVIAWGTSFSGGHVLAMGASEPGIAAVIAQCPFTDGFASALTNGPRTTVKLIARGVTDAVRAALGMEPTFVKVVGEAGEAALMTSEPAQKGYPALIPSGLEVRNEVAARFALQIPFSRPGKYVKNLMCPALICVCESDSVAPAKATLRHTKTSRMADVRVYPYGHFDIYVGDAFEEVVAEQIAFLSKHVPAD
jgi:pimeloyl-ACP methyl ester carboxylesterase